jgi:hypothetical protein
VESTPSRIETNIRELENVIFRSRIDLSSVRINIRPLLAESSKKVCFPVIMVFSQRQSGYWINIRPFKTLYIMPLLNALRLRQGRKEERSNGDGKFSDLAQKLVSRTPLRWCQFQAFVAWQNVRSPSDFPHRRSRSNEAAHYLHILVSR